MESSSEAALGGLKDLNEALYLLRQREQALLGEGAVTMRLQGAPLRCRTDALRIYRFCQLFDLMASLELRKRISEETPRSRKKDARASNNIYLQGSVIDWRAPERMDGSQDSVRSVNAIAGQVFGFSAPSSARSN